jgi:hypothetical protein
MLSLCVAPSVGAYAFRPIRPEEIDMRNHRSPADVTGVLSVFSLLAEAYRFLPWERAASPAGPAAAPAAPTAPRPSLGERIDDVGDGRNRADNRTAPRPSLGERIDRWFWRAQRRDAEAYLANSRDVFDLENRIQRLERNAWRPYF